MQPEKTLTNETGSQRPFTRYRRQGWDESLKRISPVGSKTLVVAIISLVISSGGAVGYLLTPGAIMLVSPLSVQPTSPSWNSATSCNAVVLTLEQFLGSVVNPKQTKPNAGADYSGGALPLEGAKSAGTNPASTSWPYSKRSTSPPCTVTLANGTVLPTLVEIHGVKVGFVSNDECGSVFANICDKTFNSCNAVLAPNCASSYPDTMHKVHTEIDMYWQKNGIAPPTPTSGSIIDVQGFVYWDDAHVSDSWHSFSGWEIHPLSAWRLSSSSSALTAGFTYSPTTPTTGQTITFTASASGGTSPYSFSWSFGDSTIGTGNPVTHSYSAGSYTVQLTVHDSASASTTATRTVNVGPPPQPDFAISANPGSLTILAGSSGSSKVSLNSLDGFSGQVTLSTSTDKTGLTISCSPSSLTLIAAGSANSTCTFTSPTIGTYAVTVTGTSGSLSHSTSIAVRIVDFTLSALPNSITIIHGHSATVSINLSSVNGFTGTVSLTQSDSSINIKTSLNPNQVTLAPDGTGSSSLKITALKKTTPGTYLVTVTGTVGTVSHSVTVTVNVT